LDQSTFSKRGNNYPVRVWSKKRKRKRKKKRKEKKRKERKKKL